MQPVCCHFHPPNSAALMPPSRTAICIEALWAEAWNKRKPAYGWRAELDDGHLLLLRFAPGC